MKAAVSTLLVFACLLLLSAGPVLLAAAPGAPPPPRASRSLRAAAPPPSGLAARAASLLGAGALTSQHVALLLAWEAGGEWEARTRGSSLSGEAVFEAARAQALAWQPPPPSQQQQQQQQPLVQVLVACSGFDYPRRLDPALLDLVEALQAHPRVNVTLWGPGWPRFEGGERDHTGENAGRVFGCDAFDVILFRGQGFNAMRCGGSQRAVVVQDIGDDCPRGCTADFARHADVLLSAHASPLWEIFDLDKRVDMLDRRRLFVHAPHCSSARLAAPGLRQPWRARWRAGAGAAAEPTVVALGEEWGAAAAGEAQRAPPSLAYAPASDAALAPWEAARAAAHAALAGSTLCALGGAEAAWAESTGFLTRGQVAALWAGCPLRAPRAPEELTGLLRPALVLGEAEAEEGGGAGGEGRLQRASALRAAYALLLSREALSCSARAEQVLRAVADFREGAMGTVLPFETKVGCSRYVGGVAPHAWCAIE